MIDGGDLQRIRSRVNFQSADVRCSPAIIWISDIKTGKGSTVVRKWMTNLWLWRGSLPRVIGGIRLNNIVRLEIQGHTMIKINGST